MRVRPPNILLYKLKKPYSKITIKKTLTIENKLIKLGLKQDLILIFKSFVNENNQLDSINVFKKLQISKERLDTKSENNTLIRYKNKSYDVNIEVVNDEMFHYCTCPNRLHENACSHAGAILIYKMLKNEKNDWFV